MLARSLQRTGIPKAQACRLMDSSSQTSTTRTEARSLADVLRWRTRYDGIMTVAEFDDRVVAGISGPWSGKFALTWWGEAAEKRALTLFDSRRAAKRAVETWASRESGLPLDQGLRYSAANFLGKLLPGFSRPQTRPDPTEQIERLRRTQTRVEVDLDSLHFRALD